MMFRSNSRAAISERRGEAMTTCCCLHKLFACGSAPELCKTARMIMPRKVMPGV